MYPVLFTLYGFDVHAFGFMVSLGFIGGWICLQYTATRSGIALEKIQTFFPCILVSGILGARLLFVLVHLETYINHPLEIVMIWRGGYVMYGGFLLALLTIFLLARKKGIPFLALGDAILPCSMLGLFIGRWGCFFIGDCHGKPASESLAWAIRFPRIEGSMIPEELINLPLHPTQIYMSLNGLLLFGLTLWILFRRRFQGQVLMTGLILYGLGRTVIECFRGDDKARGYFGPLSTSQWISIGLVLFALWAYRYLDRKAKAISDRESCA